jgi:hypothetical protein
MAVFITACGKPSKQADSDNEISDPVEDAEDIMGEDTQPAQDTSEASGENDNTSSDSDEADYKNLKTIVDFSEYWNYVFDFNSEALNNYEGMPIMELFLIGTCFVSGVQYDMLNLYNEEGRFEGELMLAGFPAFVEKNGSKLTFGYEEVREEDGFSPSMKAGDKEVQTGNCDLKEGHYYADDYTERESVVINRTITELSIEDDGDISGFLLDGNTLNYRNEEELTTSFTFVRNGKNQYDFVVATAALGTDFEVLKLEEDMTKEKAIQMFEAAGLTIETSGGIDNGKIVVDEEK